MMLRLLWTGQPGKAVSVAPAWVVAGWTLPHPARTAAKRMVAEILAIVMSFSW